MASASSSLAFPSFQQSKLSTSHPSPFLLSLSQSYPHRRRSARLVTASVSEKSSSTSAVSVPKPVKLPIRKIPGSYGIPIISPLKDRQEYFYGQGGRDEFFKSRVQKYQSTVFRTNMPPGPGISSNPNVVVLLDGKSFPVLFDVSKVEKKDLFTGTYMPSTELTGGYRMLSYLDPSEPKHAQLKELMFHLLKTSRNRIMPEFSKSYTELFESLERELAKKGKAGFNEANDQAAFKFLGRSYFDSNPVDTKLGSEGPKIIGKWVLFNLAPILNLGLPAAVQEPLLHTFRLPAALIKKDYQKLYDYFYEASSSILDEAEKLGVSRDEACHNIIFATCFNAFGGIKIIFPNTLKWIGRGGAKLHSKLAKEIRSAVLANGGKVTMASMEQMPLMKSLVYEALRLEPPVSLQYGRAKRDLIIESHDAAFEVKEGEMLFGYQPFATKDPKIFDRPDEFVSDRFIGEGEELLKHVLWSNGPETESPTVGNKQCAGKDFGVLVTRLFVVELFLRYDSFEIEVDYSPLGAKVTLTSLKMATS